METDCIEKTILKPETDNFIDSDTNEKNLNNRVLVKRSLWQSVSVEPVMFLYMFAYMLTSVVEESLFVDKACRIDLGLPVNVCDHINGANNTFYKKQVQLVVSNFRQYESIALHAVPMILALQLGAWSDRHGRKLPMLLGLSGALFYAVMLIVNITQDWPLNMVLYTATFPSAITGSALAVFLAGFTYISDVTTAEQRTQRVTFLEVAYLIPMPTGVAVGSYIFSNVVNKSYTIMFCIHSVLVAVAILYACLTMEKKSNKKTVGELQEHIIESSNSFNESEKCVVCDLWNWNIIIESFRTVFKKRPQKRRMYLLLTILAMGFYTFQRDEKHMVFLYTQLKFHWSITEFSHFRTFQSALYVVGLLLGVPMMIKLFSFSDTVVIMCGSIAHASARIVFATAQQPSLFYVGAAVATYGPIVAPVLRSMTSKLVPPSERGKAFSMLTVADTSVPVISGAIYSQIYNATINVAPSSFFWVTVTTQLFVFAIVLFIHLSLGGNTISQAEDDNFQPASASEYTENS